MWIHGTQGGPKRASNPVGMELQRPVNHHTWAANQRPVLYKSIYTLRQCQLSSSQSFFLTPSETESTCQKFVACVEMWLWHKIATPIYFMLCITNPPLISKKVIELCDEMNPSKVEKNFISAGHCVFRERLNAMHRLLILVQPGSWRETFQVPRQLSFPWGKRMWTLISLPFKSLYIVFFFCAWGEWAGPSVHI